MKAEVGLSQVATVADLLDAAATRLSTALDLERREARLEAQILASRALGVNRPWLLAHDRDVPAPTQAAAVEALVARREQGEPVAYILGEKEFYGRVFKVTPDVLIPRAETELLVETALEYLPKGRPAKVLDLGTGSGCIAVTLALERPSAQITAVDKMDAALAVARYNAARLDTVIEVVKSHWFSGLGGQRFDLIVANPPYVAIDDVHLDQGDVRHEPSVALVAGAEGLDDLRQIVNEAPAFLTRTGCLILEHGYNQAEIVRKLLEAAEMRSVRFWTDLAGIPRVSGGHVSE